jgi:hypothetical protein
MVKPEERLPVSVRRKVIKEELPAFGTMCRTTEPTDDILHGFLQFDLHRLLGEGVFEIRRAGDVRYRRCSRFREIRSPTRARDLRGGRIGWMSFAGIAVGAPFQQAVAATRSRY